MVSTRGVRYKFSEGERVLCYEPDPTKAKVLYDSKVLEVIENKDKRGRRTIEYLIHFQGWNSSWDRCVGEDFVLKDTEENRQLQRDLAEKAQLQLGAYLYRRERKKGSTSGSAGSSAAKRSRHRFSDDGSSSSTQPDEPDGEEAEDGEPEHSQESPEEDIEEEMESDSSESSDNEHDAPGPNGDPILVPVGRAHITMPPVLRDRLTFDYHLIVKRNRLTRLPASPCAAQILESFVKWFARTGAWNTPRCRNEPPQKPDLADVSRKLNLVREVVDGIRVYFDFIMCGNLLYKPEVAQYHQVCGQFLDQQEHKMKEELESDGLSQEEYDDLASAEEDIKSPKIPEYSHLPPDPIQAPDIKENGNMMDVNHIKQEIKEEPDDLLDYEEGDMAEEMDAELQEEMREAMQHEMEEGMYEEMPEDEEMQQEIKEEFEDQEDYQDEQDDYIEEPLEIHSEIHEIYHEVIQEEIQEIYQDDFQEEQDEYQEDYQDEIQEGVHYDIQVEMTEDLDEEIQTRLLLMIMQEIEEEIHQVVREELQVGIPDEILIMQEDIPQAETQELQEQQMVQEVPILIIAEVEKEDLNTEDSQLAQTECPQQVSENYPNVDIQSPNEATEVTPTDVEDPGLEKTVLQHSQAEGLSNRLRSHDLLREALRQVSENHSIREGLRSQSSESHGIREGLRSQSTDGHVTREGLRSQESHVTREGLRNQSSDGHSTREGLRSQESHETRDGLRNQSSDDQATKENLRNQSPDGQAILEGLRNQTSDGHSTREGLRSQSSDGHVTREGLRSQESHVTREGLRSQGSEGHHIREGLRSQSMEGHSPRSPAVDDTFGNPRKELHRPNTRSRRGPNSPATGSNSPGIQRGNSSPGLLRGNSSPGFGGANSPAVEYFPDRAAAEDPNSFANTIRNQIRPATRGQHRRWNNLPATPPVVEEPQPQSVEAPSSAENQEPEMETSSPATRTRARSGNRKSINSPAPNSPVVSLPAVNSPAVNSPSVNSPAVNSPSVSSSTNDTVNIPTSSLPVINSPAVNSPTVDSSVLDSLVVNSPAIDSSEVNSPAVNSPAINSPAVDSAAVNTAEDVPLDSKAPEEVPIINEIKKEPRDPEITRPATRNVGRRLRSHKSAVSQSENEEPQPSTSRAEHRNFEHSSSICSGSGSSNEEWQKPAEPAQTPSSSTRTPLSLLLDKVSKYEVIPREGTEHLPCRVYGAIHLARLFVRLSDFLNATEMPDFKLKLVVKYIDMFIQYLVEHKEWFGDKYYYCDSMSRST